MTTDAKSPPGLGTSWLIPLLVAIAAITAYLPTLGFGFVCDDTDQILQNQARFNWHSVPSYFATDVWSYLFLVKTNYYRPIFMLWLMLNYQFAGQNTVIWHAVAVLAHAAAALLVYFLARRLTGRRWIAGAAGLLFAVHPAHVEAVAWLSGSTETLFTLLAVGTLLCRLHSNNPDSRHPSAWRGGEIGLFALAMFAKETAVVLPLILLGWDWLLHTLPADRARKRFSQALASIMPHLALIMIYLAARYHALGSFAPLTRHWASSWLIFTMPFAVSFYLRQLLLPFQYSLFYPIEPVKHFGVSEVLLPAIVVLAGSAAAIWICRRSRTGAACVLLLALPLLPVLNLRAFPFDDFLHDRYTYLPSVGLCILAAIGLAKLGSRRVQAGLLAAAAAVLAVITVRASQPWNDNLALYTHAVSTAPESVIATEYLSTELVKEERWTEALPLLQNVLLRDPNNYDLYTRLARTEYGLGEVDQAISFYHDAITLSPQNSDAYLNLSVVEFRQNMLPQAEGDMRMAMARRPSRSPLYGHYHLHLAQILDREDKLSEASVEYQAELREDPGSEEATVGLDSVRKRMQGIQ